MTTLESAIYNRISTKCHLFVKTYYPGEYRALSAAADAEYHSRQSRRTSIKCLQDILNSVQIEDKSLKQAQVQTDENYWNDPIDTTTCEAGEDISDIL